MGLSSISGLVNLVASRHTNSLKQNCSYEYAHIQQKQKNWRQKQQEVIIKVSVSVGKQSDTIKGEEVANAALNRNRSQTAH